MTNNSLIKSISLPIVWKKFLDENGDLSLSKICQSKLIEIKENRSSLTQQIERLRAIIKRQSSYITELEDKLEKCRAG